MGHRERILDKGWLLRDEPVSVSKDDYKKVLRKKKWMKASVPGDVRLDLLTEGKISEPAVGCNAFGSEWVEKKSWWYKNEFTVAGSWKKYERIDLFCESLDIGADIFINGEFIAFHPTAYRPFTKNIKPLLRFGNNEKNLILIRLTTGNLDLPEDIQEFALKFNPPREKSIAPHRYDAAHPFLRKPAYTWGWDWVGRAATCGISGKVSLIPRAKAHIAEVSVKTQRVLLDKADIRVQMGIYNNSYFSDCRVTVHTTISDGRSPLFQKIQQLDLISGYNRTDLDVEIPNPRLWWPSGSGKQHMYTVTVSLHDDSRELDSLEQNFGIRTVRIEQQRLNSRERRFSLAVNGKSLFCRGGNWVPADSFPVRITPEKYETLIREARDAGFNMLRVWGGGLYEPDLFYDLCDRYGIMVWQDFMFACAAYPENDEFKTEIAEEAEYQVKRLRHHPSIVLWCGNNENNWGSLAWGGWDIGKEWGGSIYADILSRTAALHDPETPFWTSSPWGGETPNSDTAGDMHCWDWAWDSRVENRISPELFDGLKTKFASEYGHIGPPVKETVLEYVGGKKHYSMDDPAFKEHMNVFMRNPDTVKAGIEKFYRNTENISLDDYLFYGGLVQGQMYGYTLESFRYRKPECSGVLFWMYNDCWGEIGWTIIDYYLRRKLSWYYVRRAYAPVRVIIRNKKDEANIRIINDLPHAVDGDLEFGYKAYDGSVSEDNSVYSHMTDNSFSNAVSFPLKKYDLEKGCFYARFTGNRTGVTDTAVYRHAPWRELILPEPAVKITERKKTKDGIHLTLRADTYAHAVHFTDLGSGIPEDCYFDMLPGTDKTVFIRNGLKKTGVQAVSL